MLWVPQHLQLFFIFLFFLIEGTGAQVIQHTVVELPRLVMQHFVMQCLQLEEAKTPSHLNGI